MAWLKTIAADEATGRLRKLYDAATVRAGRVFGILRAMSLSPAALEAAMGLYRTVMFAPRGLPRWKREMLAVVVSDVNDCHY